MIDPPGYRCLVTVPQPPRRTLASVSLALFLYVCVWPGTFCVVEDDLKLLILRPPPPECWDCGCVTPPRWCTLDGHVDYFNITRAQLPWPPLPHL